MKDLADAVKVAAFFAAAAYAVPRLYRIRLDGKIVAKALVVRTDDTPDASLNGGLSQNGIYI